MKGALDVHRELLSRDVPHEIVRLPHPVSSADDLPGVLGLPPDRCVAVRVLDVDGELVAVLLPVSAGLDESAVLATMHGQSVRQARPAAVSSATEYPPQLVPPLPLPAGLTLLADPSVGGRTVVYAPTGESGTALGIDADALVAASRAQGAAVRRNRPVAALRSAGAR